MICLRVFLPSTLIVSQCIPSTVQCRLGALRSLGNLAWLLEAVQLRDRVCGFTSAKVLSFVFGLVMLNRVSVE